jgi:hypothetical protein
MINISKEMAYDIIVISMQLEELLMKLFYDLMIEKKFNTDYVSHSEVILTMILSGFLTKVISKIIHSHKESGDKVSDAFEILDRVNRASEIFFKELEKKEKH